jgi:adenylate kinase family enzyme
VRVAVKESRRWLLLGAGGSGKTTLAVELGRILSLPLIHLDRHYWGPGWVAPPDDVWEARVRKLVQQDEWIMDGNYSRTLDLRLPRAQAVILLDPPTVVSLSGVIRRGLFQRGRGRIDLPDGCQEHAPSAEFLRYVVSYKWRSRPKVLNKVRGASHVRFFHLRSRGEAQRFLRELRRA